MAKKRKPVDKNSASYQYKKQWERINNYIKELEKQGYTVDETDLPTKKKKPVMKSVENLKHDWSYRALKKIAYKTFPDTNGGEFKVSKSEFEYQRYLQKQEAKKRERKAKKENRPTKKPSIPKNKMSFTHYVMEKPSSNESENIAKEFEDSLKNLGVQAQVEETETEEVKYVPIEEVGISRTDVYSGWKHVGREDGMDVFQPKKINEKIYVDLMSGKFFVKRTPPSMSLKSLEALSNLIPAISYYDKVAGGWAEQGIEVSYQLRNLFELIQNTKGEEFERILNNVSSNYSEIEGLINAVTHSYKEMEQSDTNISKLYKLITGESMSSTVAAKINNYDSFILYLENGDNY